MYNSVESCVLETNVQRVVCCSFSSCRSTRILTVHVHVCMSAAGLSHMICATEDGAVFGWGKNAKGCLGMGSDAMGVVVPHPVHVAVAIGVTAVAADVDYSAAVCRDGQLFMWGTNDHGQLGTGDKLPRPVRTPNACNYLVS